ncbi:hypothetical protein O0235_09210 [Tepidiforma flava]|uniref:DNA replication and repair protein RecF n=1 Tax=Tepidiforma flava TaxID=3004094 RepID=A0ABY7M2T0_9CHLR|nr:hypothetical protein [Tepidiforma flava]WBL34972.1 hypothetical protein O0235_09210 [Tepidiforma flava]
MQKYARVLQQRNSLLKRIQAGAKPRPTSSPSGTRSSPTHGGTIYWARADALGHLAIQAEQQMERLSDGLESLTLIYRPSIGGLDQYDAPIDDAEWTGRMLKALQAVRQREIAAGATLVGPHRDDVEVLIDGMPADAFASRAQQRTAALAMRLAEASYLRRALGDDPVVLALDDVLSELDARRRRALLEYIDTFQQTLVTTADIPTVSATSTPAPPAASSSTPARITRFEGE